MVSKLLALISISEIRQNRIDPCLECREDEGEQSSDFWYKTGRLIGLIKQAHCLEKLNIMSLVPFCDFFFVTIAKQIVLTINYFAHKNSKCITALKKLWESSWRWIKFSWTWWFFASWLWWLNFCPTVAAVNLSGPRLSVTCKTSSCIIAETAWAQITITGELNQISTVRAHLVTQEITKNAVLPNARH